MLQIKYPAFDFRIKQEDNKDFIFDEVRKKWVTLSPEEWVRQNFIQYLLQLKQYPRTVIAIEKEIRLGDLKKRCDIVVYRDHIPWMIVECKEQSVVLSEAVIEQVLRYNIQLDVQVLVITNGSHSYAVQLKDGSIIPLDALPDWAG